MGTLQASVLYERAQSAEILGTRIKHQMGEVSVKMYDKAGIILRIECTSNDVSQFKQVRDVATVQKTAPVNKSIYSLFVLANIFKGVVKRYLEYVSEFDDPSDGIKKLDKVTKDVRKDDRNYKGFNFFSHEDQKVFETIARGEFNIRGMQNKNLRCLLLSRSIKRLRTHGLIRKVKNSYKYYLTSLGKSVIVAGLKIKSMLLTS
jgi:predicted transcriptional regulator